MAPCVAAPSNLPLACEASSRREKADSDPTLAASACCHQGYLELKQLGHASLQLWRCAAWSLVWETLAKGRR